MKIPLNPTPADLARELAAAAAVVANPAPAVYKGVARGTTKPLSWQTNVAFWEANEIEPAKIAPGDTAAANSWLRINAEVARLSFLANLGTPSQSWDPEAPTWPLPTPPIWPPSPGSLYGARRPWSQKQAQKRKHCGIDLKAEAGTPVLAPEPGTIVAPNSGWDFNAKTQKGVKALIMTTNSGVTLLLGGIEPGSASVQAGQKVIAGQPLAVIGRYPGVNGKPGPSMLHVQMYGGALTESQVNARKSWPMDQPPPPNLMDPKAFLKAAAGNPKFVTMGLIGDGDGDGLVVDDVEGGELNEGGEQLAEVVAAEGRTGTKPCKVYGECNIEDVKAWQIALNAYWNQAEALRKKAKERADKGKAWTPEASAAAGSLDSVKQLLLNDKNAVVDVFDAVYAHVDACRLCIASGETLKAFAGASAAGVKKKGSGGMLIAAGLGVALLGVGVMVVASKSKRTQKSLVIDSFGSRAA